MKRVIALFLCIILCLSLFPVGAFAEEESTDIEVVDITSISEPANQEEPQSEPIEESENILESAEEEPAEEAELTAAAASGECGDNLTWTLDDAGTLTISGTGAMTDYQSCNTPWYYGYSSPVQTAVIGPGVTTIGSNAFAYCDNLKTLSIADSVTTIRDSAFTCCYNLADVTIPEGVTVIGDSAFRDCRNLTSVTIGRGVTAIGVGAFEYCNNLTDVYYTGSEDQWNEIDIDSWNDPLLYSENIYYNCDPQQYTVRYDANGGEGAPDDQTQTKGTELVLSASAPTRDGYTFFGWGLSRDAVKAQYQPGDTYSANVSVKLYAVWGTRVDSPYDLESAHSYPDNCDRKWYYTDPEAEAMLLTFDARTETENWSDYIYIYDGDGNVAGQYSGTWLAGQSIAVRGNTVCIRLTSDDSGTAWGFKVSDYKTVRLSDTVTVTYDANGGNAESVPVSQTKGIFDMLTLSDVMPTRSGHVFLGWATSPDAAAAELYPQGGFIGYTDVTLYAVWGRLVSSPDELESEHNYPDNCDRKWYYTDPEAEALILSFDARTETESGQDFIIVFNGLYLQGYYSGTNLAGKDILVRSNTVGIQLTSNESNSFWGFKVTGCRSVSSADTVTVTYDANGGDEDSVPAPQTKGVLDTITLSDGRPTLNGSDLFFRGWATSPDAEEAEYQPGDEYSGFEDLTLYALWDAIFVSSPDELESAHNYPDNFNQLWCYTDPEAEAMLLTFDELTETESGYDFITVYDGEGHEVGQYSGTELAGQTIGVYGNTVCIRLTSDGSNTYWGFRVSDYKAVKANVTVTYNANGGDEASVPAQQTKGVLDTITLSNSRPTLNGSDLFFLGWATSPDAEEAEYQPGDEYSGFTDITLYVLWDAIFVGSPDELESAHNYSDDCDRKWVYTDPEAEAMLLTFDERTETERDYDYITVYDGEGHEVGQYSGTELAGQTIGVYGNTVCIHLTSDYSGNYWGFRVSDYKAVKANVTVTYNANGGDEASVPAQQTKGVLDTITLSDGRPTLNGSDLFFRGWATSPEAEEAEYQPGDEYRGFEDITLYALWDAIYVGSPDELESKHNYPNNCDRKWVYTDPEAEAMLLTFDERTETESGYDFITVYDGEGGEVGKYSGTELAGQTIGVYGNTVCIHLTSDYSGNYWGFRVSDYKAVKANVTVTYNANGGDEASVPAQQTKGVFDSVTLSDTEPTRSGYHFIGWATSPEAEEAEYQPGDEYSGFTDITLYAVWEKVYIASGTCGDNLTWTLDDAGTLTITGTGAMTDFSGSPAPWESEMESIKTLILENGVTSIGETAFIYCGNLVSVTIPDSVIEIGMGAFAFCGLTEVTIPDSVTSIGMLAFACGDLTAINVSDGNSHYSSADGVLFNKEKDILLEIPGAKTEYSIPAGVVGIGDGAFAYCVNLTEVTIPDGVTSIAYAAFGYSEKLTSVTIPASVTAIGESAFEGCNNLADVYYTGSEDQWNEIDIGEGNYSLDSAYIFYNCDPQQYTVRYDANGGEGAPQDQTQARGTELVLSASVPTRDGCTFLGWATNKSAMSAQYRPGDTYSKNASTMLYAVWGIFISSPVEFESEHNYPDNCDQHWYFIASDAETEVLLLSFDDQTRTENNYDYIFIYDEEGNEVGRYTGTELAGETIAVYGKSVCIRLTSDGSSTYYGVKGTCLVAKSDVTVTYDANGGDEDSVPAPQTKGIFDMLTLSDVTPTRSGSRFLGWATSPDATEAEYQPGDEYSGFTDITLYAVWAEPVSSPDELESAHNYPNNCDRRWYYTDPEAEAMLLTFDERTQTERNYDYIIIYDGEDNEIGRYTGTELAGQTIVVYGNTVCIHLTSDGSITNWGFKVSSYKAVKATDTVTVTYDANGGDAESVPAPQTKGFFDTITLSDGRPTHSNGVFLGWATDPDACYADYQPKSDFSGYTDITLYAVWEYSSVASGVCGAKLKWMLDKEGTLTISGTGAMTDYSYSYYNTRAPWDSIRSSIKTVKINSGVTSIGDYAFSDCTGLTSVTIPDSVTRIGSDAFYDCDRLTSVTIPDSVTRIGYEAFYSCNGLTSVTIPNSVTGIGNYAFSSCDSLTSVTIPDSVTSIGDYVFYWCSSLTSVTIPDSVTSIGSDAFSDCRSLTSVTIPDSVTSIGESAFFGCESLTSVTIPDSVTSIGSGAFADCSNLMTINASGQNNVYTSEDGVLFNKNKSVLIAYPGGKTGAYSIPDSVTGIGNYAFSFCDSLTSVTIPDSVTRIGSDAFYGCTGLTSVTIPDSVTGIGNYAFSFCDSLTSVTIPDSVTSISSNAFSYCTRLTSVTIPDSVTRIGSDAFYDCDRLTSVTIPDSVTRIGEKAFYNCDSLTSVTIGNSVTSIGYEAFYRCSGLKDVYYTGSEAQWKKISIGLYNSYLTSARIHYNCVPIDSGSTGNLKWSISNDGLLRIDGQGKMPDFKKSEDAPWYKYTDKIKKLELGENVTSIGKNAFSGCAFTELTIPGNIISVGDNAFSFCRKLTDVKIENGTEKIGIGAFTRCAYLQSVQFPESIETIGENCLSFTDVQSFSFPGNIRKIPDAMFETCLRLKTVKFTSSVRAVGDYAFCKCPGLAKVIFDGEKEAWDSISVGIYNEDFTRITPTFFELSVFDFSDNSNITIPYSGTAYAYYSFNPDLPNMQVKYYIDEDKEANQFTASTDENAILAVRLGNYSVSNNPNISSTVYFTEINGKKLELPIAKQVTIKVLNKSRSDSLTIQAGLAAGVEVGKPSFFGAEVGLTDSLEISRDYSGSISSMSLKYTDSGSIKVTAGSKSDPIAKTDDMQLSPIKIGVNGSAKANLFNGVSIPNYTENAAQKRVVGTYLIKSLGNVAFKGNVFFSYLNELLGEKCLSERAKATAGVKMTAGVGYGVGYGGTLSAVSLKVGDWSLFSAGDASGSVNYGYSIMNSEDSSGNDITLTSTLKTSKSLSGLTIKPTNTTNLGSDILGTDIRVKASTSENGFTLNYTALAEPEKIDVTGWIIRNESYSARYNSYKFSGDTLNKLEAANPGISSFLSVDKQIFTADDCADIKNFIETSGKRVDYSNLIEKGEKNRVQLKIPIEEIFYVIPSFECVAKTSYSTENGFYVKGKYYPVSEEYEFIPEYTTVSPQAFVDDCMEAIRAEIAGEFTDIVNGIQEGVETAWGWVKGKAKSSKDWIVGIFTTADDFLHGEAMAFACSYTVSTLPEGTLSAAGLGEEELTQSVTIGKPFFVSVTDSSGQKISDFSEEPLEFTIRYAEEDLEAAGLSSESGIVRSGGIKMFRYSDYGDFYEYVGGENDIEEMTVTAELVRDGQYILIVDTSAPVIDDVYISDFGSTPVITATITDLTGIDLSSFVFSMDDTTLVDSENVSEHYDVRTAEFSYAVPEEDALSEGTHELEFTVADTRGNSTVYDHSFTVDLTAPVIENAEAAGYANPDSTVEIRAAVTDENLAEVRAEISVLLEDGTWSDTTETQMEDLGDGLWGLDYTGDGKTVHITIAAEDIAGLITESDEFTVYPLIDGIAFENGYIAISKGNEYTVPVVISPSGFTREIRWSTEENDQILSVEDGKITGINTGTAYLVAETEGEENSFRARCRVEVIDEAVVPDTPVIYLTRSDGGLKVFWNAVDYASLYRVYRADADSGDYTLLCETSDVYYIDSALDSDNAYYYYKVIAIAPYGAWSGNSNIAVGSISAEAYTISFDANGGVSLFEPLMKAPDAAVELPAAIPVRAGCSFLGWAADAEAAEATYQPGDIYTENADITLYAVWKKETDSILTLPAALTKIEAEAFTGVTAEVIVVPAGVTEIGSKAFANCPNLSQVIFLGDFDSITIADDYLYGCEGVEIVTP